MEEFFKNHIPKENTPANYGGEQPTIEELNANYHKDLLAMKEYFAWEEHQRKKDQNGNDIV